MKIRESIREAVKHYEEYIKKTDDKELIEKIILKIARIIPDYDESVKYYKYFFTRNPDSRYNFIARYELAILHKLNGNNGEALKEFMTLAKESKDNKFYSEKANINIAEIEIENLKYDDAASRLAKMADNSDDYDDNGKIYYLLGLTKFKQGMLTDAEKNFLTVAGTFPLSGKAAASLYELIMIYKNNGKIKDAERTSLMLVNHYPDSLEAFKVKDMTNPNAAVNDDKNSGAEPVELKKVRNISSKFHDVLLNDLNDSIILTDEKNNGIESGYYIQLGYYSTKENADLIAENCRKKWIKDIFVAKTRSNDSKKIFTEL